ncbi:hypothetical protein V6N13_028199 [Hibiscus sabdariffa]
MTCKKSLRNVIIVVLIIFFFIFFVHNLWTKIVTTTLGSKGIESDVHGVLARLNGLKAMIHGSKALIHMSDKRCKLPIQISYHEIKRESLRRRRSNWSLRSIFDIGGWHTLWKLVITHHSPLWKVNFAFLRDFSEMGSMRGTTRSTEQSILSFLNMWLKAVP